MEPFRRAKGWAFLVPSMPVSVPQVRRLLDGREHEDIRRYPLAAIAAKPTSHARSWLQAEDLHRGFNIDIGGANNCT